MTLSLLLLNVQVKQALMAVAVSIDPQRRNGTSARRRESRK